MATLNLKDEIQLSSFLRHYNSHIYDMVRNVQGGRLQEALESTQPQATCGENCRPDLQEHLKIHMLHCMLDNRDEPEYLTRSAVKDMLSRLMALESLQNNQSGLNRGIFDNIVRSYYPNNVKIFFDTFTLNIHDTHRQKFLKNVCSAMERRLSSLLQGMESSGSKEELREMQKTFSDLIQAMAIPFHDDTVPAIPYPVIIIFPYHCKDDHCPLFTSAVKLKLAPEALLLYDAGAVGNKELRLLAKDPDIQKVLKSEEDKSVLAVFLRKVLNRPRSLESLATMQVSRLLGCHALPDKEQRARGLGLLDCHVERGLLRRQCELYRAALKQADNEDKAGASQ